ncbi:MAG TPA: methyltransferase domain-containing protein [bacterium]|nr:methyltransferase domain-containing protein [bacterium]
MGAIGRDEGRSAFGADPAGYDAARPDYPERVYDILRTRCGLRPGARTFEIGPGTGQATRRLLRFGADPLIVVEPDARLAEHLVRTLPHSGGRLTVNRAPFETAELPCGWFDLGVAATVFHWLDQLSALRKAADLLRRGGWWAMWWNVFGDPTRPDPFHEATRHLLQHLPRGPSSSAFGRPFALDCAARTADLRAAGAFDRVECETIRWAEAFDPARVKALYATFPSIDRLPLAEREGLLAELGRIAEEAFGGRVERPLVTPVYTARRI